jgi:protein-disulfide isomerase
VEAQLTFEWYCFCPVSRDAHVSELLDSSRRSGGHPNCGGRHMARHIDAHTIAVSKRDHSQGSAHAPILLVTYGDYECRDSGAAYRMIRDAQRELGADVRFVFRNFPMRDVHPRAQRAAEAAEAAAAQGRFWEMHARLFEHQHALTDRHLRDYAASIGLDALRFDCELAARVHAKRVRDDVAGAAQLGVSRAPTFFINGVRYEGACDLSALLRALEQQVAA